MKQEEMRTPTTTKVTDQSQQEQTALLPMDLSF